MVTDRWAWLRGSLPLLTALTVAACPPSKATEDQPNVPPDTEVTDGAQDEVNQCLGPGCPEVALTACVNFAADGSCADCTVNGCGNGVCHPDLKTCVGCVSDADCPAFCHPSALYCVSCWNDSQCGGGGQCTDAGLCIECVQDADCEVGVCNPALGACVGACKDDDACADGNPCTQDLCDDNNECVYLPEPDGTTCNDGDVCTGDGFCLGGACLAGRSQCCDPEPPCGPLGVLVDVTGDGCVDACVCVDGTAPDAAGNCQAPCGFVGIECPPGTAPKDENGDGCDDICACIDADCVQCNGADDVCDDGDPCTQDLCVNGACVSLDVPDCGECKTSCDCLQIGNADNFAPPCPLDCATCGNWWGCVGGTCVVTCGAQPLGLETCSCDPVACPAGTTATDTSGDGCADSCACADGLVPPPGEECPNSGSACVTGCDCLGLPLTNALACEDQCGGCKNHWACVGGTCQEVCGLVPPDANACEGQQLCEATGGVYDMAACGDYACGMPNECLAVIGGCNCGPGMNFSAIDGCFVDDSCGSQPICPNIGCSADFGAVDVDGDGCPDACICSDNGDCAPDALCLRQPGQCSGLGTCSAQPTACPPVQAGDVPVCGCDGAEYGSACQALAAGVNIATLTFCGAVPPAAPGQ